MELLLKDGDYIPDGKGGFCTVTGGAELLQRVLFLLTVRRGSFPFLPELGSRLYLLTREKHGGRAALAQRYVQEALAGERDLNVTGVELSERADGHMGLKVLLDRRGERLEAEMTV